MNNDPKQLTVYLVPDTIDDFILYDGKPAIVSDSDLAIGIWRRRHDSWQIEIAVPVSVDIKPVQLHTH